jgi:hypothetical protein
MVDSYFQILEDNGIPVYPICGNHDINNPRSFAYDGNFTIPVRNVSPATFRQIFKDNAYDRAIYKDWFSLSYVVPVSDDLWIAAIDSCKYTNQGEYPETSGAISLFTFVWLKIVMQEAEAQGKTVFVFLHHGVLEHYSTQSVLFKEYLIDNCQTVSEEFAKIGIKVVFTGHYHAQDIVKESWPRDGENNIFLFDIETGSLVTAPVPYRVVTFNPTEMTLTIESHTITEIDYDHGGVPFPEYAYSYLYEGILNFSTELLIDLLEFSPIEADDLAPYTSLVFVAHYIGDEQMDALSRQKIIELLFDYKNSVKRFLGLELIFLWSDLPPPDNNITIDLITGGFE